MRDFVSSETASPPDITPKTAPSDDAARPEGCVLWVHAPSLERARIAHAIADMLSQLRDEQVSLILTTESDGAEIANLASTCLHVSTPDETAASVDKFFDHWKPNAGILLGPPGRPFLVTRAAAHDCPMFLAGTERGSFVPDGRLGILSATLLNNMELCFAPSAAEAETLRRHVPKERVRVTGPFTDMAVALPSDPRETDRIASALGGRPVWLAVSIELADLPMLEAAHRRAIRASHRLILIISPERPGNGGAFASWFETRGWRTGRRHAGDDLTDDIQIFVADRSDELGLWYRLAPTTFLGGTFDEGRATADPYGPAALGSAIIHGPVAEHALDRFNRLHTAGATALLSAPEELGDAVYALLSPDRAARMAHAGWLATTESAFAVDTLVQYLDAAIESRMASHATT